MKFFTLFFTTTFFLTTPIFAHDHSHDHSNTNVSSTQTPTLKSALKEHAHGKVSLAIAIDNKNLAILLTTASESLLGFEHTPQTEKDKATLENLKKTWETQFDKILIIPQEFGCEAKTAKLDMIFEKEEKTSKAHNHDHQHSKSGEHSEIIANKEFACKKPLVKGAFTITLKDHYENVDEIEVVLVSKDQQTKKIIKEKSTKIDF